MSTYMLGRPHSPWIIAYSQHIFNLCASILFGSVDIFILCVSNNIITVYSQHIFNLCASILFGSADIIILWASNNIILRCFQISFGL